MKIPSSVKKLLENKYVLYIVFFLALTNLFGYMVMGNYKAIALFVLVGYLVHNFNKNMILVLGVPLILTAIFTSGFIREGLPEDGMGTNADDIAAKAADDVATASRKAADADPSNKALQDKAKTDKDAAMVAANVAATSFQARNAAKAAADAKATAASTDTNTKTTDGETLKVGTVGSDFAPTTGGSTDGSSNVTVDASSGAGITKVLQTTSNTPAPNEKFSNPYDKRGSRLDYAATVEDAYGDLNKILGGDGIKNLTADTQKLMTQQLQLADAMKSMTPLLEQAKSLIGGFDMKNFGNITEMAKQFKASGSN